MATVILITGAPASGKTDLARRLAGRLALPTLAKDRIKETLFDALPVSPDWSRPLGAASYRLLLEFARELVRADVSFILENAFRSTDKDVLRGLLADADVLHIHCHAPHATLCDRLRQRVEAGERHPSHHHADVPTLIAADTYALDEWSDGESITTVRVPTDDFGAEQYRAAVALAIERAQALLRRNRRWP